MTTTPTTPTHRGPTLMAKCEIAALIEARKMKRAKDGEAFRRARAAHDGYCAVYLQQFDKPQHLQTR